MNTPLEIALEEYREAHTTKKSDDAEYERLRKATEKALEKTYDSDRAFSKAERKLHLEIVDHPQASDSVKPPEPVYNIPG